MPRSQEFNAAELAENHAALSEALQNILPEFHPLIEAVWVSGVAADLVIAAYQSAIQDGKSTHATTVQAFLGALEACSDVPFAGVQAVTRFARGVLTPQDNS